MTQNIDLINKIVDEKKKLIERRQIPELLQYFLFGEGNGIYWSSWFKDPNFQTWKHGLMNFIKIKKIYKTNSDTEYSNNEFTTIGIQLENELFEFEYSKKFMHIDDFGVGHLNVYCNNKKLLEFMLDEQYSEYGTGISLSSLEFLRDNENLKKLEILLINIKNFTTHYNALEADSDEKEKINKLISNFNINKEDIELQKDSSTETDVENKKNQSDVIKSKIFKKYSYFDIALIIFVTIISVRYFFN
jgi:hypothetical protein